MNQHHGCANHAPNEQPHFRECIEHQPGPILVDEVPPMTFGDFPELTLIENTNATSLRTRSQFIVKRKAHVARMQEATVSLHETEAMKKEFATANGNSR